jgi:hypothetical protein
MVIANTIDMTGHIGYSDDQYRLERQAVRNLTIQVSDDTDRI